jgi:hypothetical protein
MPLAPTSFAQLLCAAAFAGCGKMQALNMLQNSVVIDVT